MLDKGAAPLLGTKHALPHQCRDRAAHRMPVDAEALGQRDLGRQPAAFLERAVGNALPYALRYLPPQGHAAAALHRCRRRRCSHRLCHSPVILPRY